MSATAAAANGEARPPRPIAPRPVNVRSIPALAWLTDAMHRRWVGWQYRWVVDDKGNGKWTKVPLQLSGRNAKNNDPASWSSYDEVWARIDVLDGVGVMLLGLPGDLFAAADLDDVRDPATGRLLPWAEQLIRDSGSFAEVTVSGTGTRLLGTAVEIEKLHRRKAHPQGRSFELYVNCERYITVSGQMLNGMNALADITPQLRELEALLGPSTGDKSTDSAAPIKLEELSFVIIELLTKGTLDGKPVEKRAPEFLKLVRYLHGKGYAFAQVLALLAEHPGGVQAKYAGRLETELRRVWDKLGEQEPPAPTEQEVMREFIALHHERLRFNHDGGQWLVWHEHYWKPDRRDLAFSWALDLCRNRSPSPVVQKIRFSSSVEQGARAMREVSTAQEDWDHNPWLLGTPGGAVDLRTGELRPGRPEDMITLVTGCTPAEVPECPRWLAFLDYALAGNDQDIAFVLRWLGYCLTGLTNEEFFVFLFGDAGTGKGTLTRTVREIMGDYAAVVPIEMFTTQSWRPLEYYRAKLVNKRLILAAEPHRGSVWSEAFVNEMTGSDPLSARHPAGRPFDFIPTHKPLIYGNYMPRLHGIGSGLKRRLGVLPVNRKPEKPDPGLKAALQAEGPQILRLMIEGCLSWQRHGLTPPASVLAASAAYFRRQDTFAQWVEDCCILDPNLQIEPSKLRASFNAWAKMSGVEEQSTNDFADTIDRFQGATLRRFASNGKRWVRGIGLQVSSEERDRWGNGE